MKPARSVPNVALWYGGLQAIGISPAARAGPPYLLQPALAGLVVEAIHDNARVLAHFVFESRPRANSSQSSATQTDPSP